MAGSRRAGSRAAWRLSRRAWSCGIVRSPVDAACSTGTAAHGSRPEVRSLLALSYFANAPVPCTCFLTALQGDEGGAGPCKPGQGAVIHALHVWGRPRRQGRRHGAQPPSAAQRRLQGCGPAAPAQQPAWRHALFAAAGPRCTEGCLGVGVTCRPTPLHVDATRAAAATRCQQPSLSGRFVSHAPACGPPPLQAAP